MSDLRDRVIREITVAPGWNKEDATALVDALLAETALRDEGHETTREDDRLWSQSFARISRRPTMSDRELTSLELVEAFERESGAFDGPSVNVSPPYPGIVPTWPRLIRERALAEDKRLLDAARTTDTWNDGFAKGLGCRCPKSWWGVLPPPCPLHNPAQATITTTGTNNLAAPAPLDGLDRLRKIEHAAREFADNLSPRSHEALRAALRDEGETT